jgi:protoporphyrinogen oxidase
MRIGIIGGGIAGLGLALRICKGAQNGQQAFVRIYETNPYCGGRIHTKIVEA